MLPRPRPRPFGAKVSITKASRRPTSSLVGVAAAAAPQHQPHQPPSTPTLSRRQQLPRSNSKAFYSTSASTPTSAPSSVIFSGIQPTGAPHLGNYLGALKQWVHLQDAAGGDDTTTSINNKTKLLFSVVDLHALTAPPRDDEVRARRGEVLRRQRRETMAALLAVGLDPERSIIFYQSECSAHSELMWLLSCTASMGYLSRMTQWKSKLSLSQDTEALDDEAKTKLKLGLFSYPVLQAADIMAHGATHVPVGDDQKQHLEFTRECAKNFNHAYGKSILIPPKTIFSPARRVMSLQNPTVKMSKSDPNPKSRIAITDTPDQIRSKIMSALTDAQSHHVTYDPVNRPGVANLLEILSLLSPPSSPSSSPSSPSVEQQGQQRRKTPEEIAAEGFVSQGGGPPLKALKARTADAVVRELGDVRARYLSFLEDRGGEWLDAVAARGAEKANANARATMKRVKEAVGLL